MQPEFIDSSARLPMHDKDKMFQVIIWVKDLVVVTPTMAERIRVAGDNTRNGSEHQQELKQLELVYIYQFNCPSISEQSPMPAFPLSLNCM